MYLCVKDGSANRCGVTGQGTAVTTFWMSHNPALLTAKVNLSKLCSSSTGRTELRPDHLVMDGKTVRKVGKYINSICMAPNHNIHYLKALYIEGQDLYIFYRETQQFPQ